MNQLKMAKEGIKRLRKEKKAKKKLNTLGNKLLLELSWEKANREDDYKYRGPGSF